MIIIHRDDYGEDEFMCVCVCVLSILSINDQNDYETIQFSLQSDLQIYIVYTYMFHKSNRLCVRVCLSDNQKSFGTQKFYFFFV